MGKAIASQDYEQLFWVAGRIKVLTDSKLQASTGVIQALAGHHTGINHISNEHGLVSHHQHILAALDPTRPQ